MIIIDPGHGGTDPGALGPTITEKDYTLKISQYQASRLKQLGIPFGMTRTDDTTLMPPERITKINDLADAIPGVVMIDNHLNAGGGNGAEIVYSIKHKDILPKLIAQNLQAAGQNVRKIYRRTLPDDPAQDYYYFQRESPSNVEPILVEYGFLDSTTGDVKQLTDHWQDYAEAVIKAVAAYKHLPYSPPNLQNVYVVQPGDTLYSIASKYGVSVSSIKSLNKLGSNAIYVGQQLVVPQAGAVTYAVKPGDSLYSIANKYGTTVNQLKSINNLTTNTLQIGQQLIIPQGEATL